MKAYAVIPVRGGSKGLPRKNILPLDGRPLLAYTIQAAQAASRVARVFVSTEDAEIASVAKECGASVLPRPPELATDMATSNEVVMQCCSTWESMSDTPEVVVYLQATDIFRRRGIIDQCVEALVDDPRKDAVFAAFPEHKNYWVQAAQGIFPLNPYPNAPRQTRTPVHREDTGIACATRYAVARLRGRLGNNNAMVRHDDEFSSIDIHTIDDFWLAEQVVKRFKGTGRYDF